MRLLAVVKVYFIFKKILSKDLCSHETHLLSLSPMADEKKEPVRMDGNALAEILKLQMAEEVATIKAQYQSQELLPRLDVILVGDRKDSQTYVSMKTKACEKVGMLHEQHNLPADTTQKDLEALVQRLNNDPRVNGILVQLPLPGHLQQDPVIEAIHPSKDVDGLTTVNQGRVLIDGIKAPMIPCTPLGCIEFLKHYKIDTCGKNAVVIGRSRLVGKPVSLLLQSMDATVTMVHSKSSNIGGIVKGADIVVACLGRANYVKGDWLKEGAVVIDVGINAVDDATKKAGYRLVGDCEYDSCQKVASYITPVPGGVGPLTVSMLLRNTIKAFQLQHTSAV